VDLEALRERSRVFREIRAFFDSRGYLETDTPVLAPSLIPETCLEVFRTEYLAPAGSRSRPPLMPYWLVPSPELWMKRLLAQHRTSIYQICKCFRNGESTGRLHSPEFTMLEYYTVGVDYEESLRISEELFRAVLPADAPPSIKPPFRRMDMDEAFALYAGFPLYETIFPDVERGTARLEHEARRLGLEPPSGLGLDDLYNLIFVHAVEPSLPRDRPVVLMDYPAFVPCLAKDRDTHSKERWELYVNGIELANCYTEETRPEKVKAYFETEGAEKSSSALVPHATDPDYWKLFAGSGFPACSGVAMGLDRLIMVSEGKASIDSVLPFPMT
jgi:lysyl-tRNA synthetase class 2